MTMVRDWCYLHVLTVCMWPTRSSPTNLSTKPPGTHLTLVEHQVAAEYNTSAHLCFKGLRLSESECPHCCPEELQASQSSCYIISAMYTNTWCQVRTTKGASKELKVISRVRQGSLATPLQLFHGQNSQSDTQNDPGRLKN